MKNQILNKILNDDGSLVWKYSKTACVQKYFTKDEIEFLNNCFGKTFSEKYYCLKNDINCAPKCNCGKLASILLLETYESSEGQQE